MLSLAEEKFMEYKLNVCGSFRKSLYDTFFKADTENRKKLISAFPDLEVVNRYSNESGYWDNLLERFNKQTKQNWTDIVE